MAPLRTTQVDIATALERALALARERRFADAEALLERIVGAAPEQPDALQLMGLVAGELGDKEAAIRWFRRSLAACPTQPHVHNNLGNALMATGRSRDGVASYREAIRLAPGYADARFNLGLAYAAANDHRAALEALDRTLLLEPGSTRALNAKGIALRALGRLEEAEATLGHAVQGAPRDIRPLNNLGNVLRDRGRDAEAARCFERAIELAPAATHLRVALSGACFNLGRFEEAEKLLESVLATEPENLEALKTLKDVRFSTGRSKAVPDGYEAAIAKAPGARHVWRVYAETMWQMERHEEGLELLDRAERACGRHPMFDFWRGRLTASGGDPEGALAWLDPAVEGAEGLGRHSMAVERARVHLQSGAFLVGAKELEREAAADPDDYTLWAHLEVLWRLAGDPRASWLLDYERFVRTVELPLPDGYGDHDAFHRALAATLTGLHVSRAHPIAQTLRRGTQTFGHLFHRTEPVIRTFRDAVEEAVRSYIAELPDDPDHPFLKHKTSAVRFAGSWSVRLKSEGYHVPHYHPEGWISSACYVALPPSVADPATRDGRLEFGIPPVPVPVEVRAVKEIQPRPGTLALFPSFCWHGTVPFADVEPRLTVAFDVARPGPQ